MSEAKAAKGYDDSPPRNGVILFYTVLTVVALFGVQQLLRSYFGKMMDLEFEEKVYTVGLGETADFKAHEHEQLEKLGIDSAIKTFASRGHTASPALKSESGAGKAAITGWSQLKREVPTAPAARAAVPVEGSTLPAEAAGAEKAPARSGTTSPSQAGAAINPPGTPLPVHDDPKNSRSPANNPAAAKNTPAQKTQNNKEAPAANPAPAPQQQPAQQQK